MAITFTPEQEKVIQLHNRNILVSAAAGSGKTAVLVERIVRMVCDEAHPVDIDRLLIVTFTNAAAAEMRERIDGGIAAQLKAHPESEHIERQATLLHNAQITTIHSFCLFLIRNHFHETSLDPEHEAGLDPAFRVADENEVKLLKQDVLAELLEERFVAGEEDFLNCVEFFCPNGRESVLENDILELEEEALAGIFPEQWLEERKRDYEPDENGGILTGKTEEYLQHYLQAVIGGCADSLGRAVALCQEPDGPYMYGELLEREQEIVQGLLKCASYEEYATRIPAVVFDRLPGKKDASVDPAKRELAQALRNEVKDRLKKLTAEFFQTSISTAKERAEGCGRALRTLLELTLDFHRRVQAKKAEKKIIDFSDMEHLALDILLERTEDGIKPSRVAQEYRQYFHEILIDEYQDSNLAQEALLQAISGEDEGHFNRFMVGDVKQSIYGFRQARPDIFLEKYDNYAEDGEMLCRINLSKNYRSRTQVVDTVNSVFGCIMSREVGGIEYDENARLYAQASYVESSGNESEFLLIEKPEKDEADPKQTEAKAVADRIRDLRKNFQVMDKETGALRPVQYSDMVILLRTNSGWDEEFKTVMEQEGIPVYITSKTGYFAATEVQELLQVLRTLDNPRQDIPLYGMMKSVFGGFTEEEIVQIRVEAGERRTQADEVADPEKVIQGKKRGTGISWKQLCLYEALCLFAEGSSSSDRSREEHSADMTESGQAENVKLSAKAAAFLEKLNRYRSYTVYMPIRELLQKLVEEHDYLNYVTALPAGSRRRANVEMLFTKASDFEKTSYFGLFHFVRYMEQLEKYEVDYGEADMLDENADVVRIMSIHKSKGLEFPVTFVSGLGKQFNEQDSRGALITDMDMGLGVTFMDPKSRIRCKTLRQNVIAKKMWEDTLAEELRVLYVALTRAKEKLILTGTIKDAAAAWTAAQENAQERLDYLKFITARSYLDLMLPILAKADFTVKVIDREHLAGAEVKEQLNLELRRERLMQITGNIVNVEMPANTEGTDAIGDVREYVPQGNTNKEDVQKLRDSLSYIYPHWNLEKLYTKTTVSELKAEAMAERDEEAHDLFEVREREPYVPSFATKEAKISGTLRGSAFHRAMELLDFEGILGKWFETLPEDYTAYREGLQYREDSQNWPNKKDQSRLRYLIEEFLREQLEEKRLSKDYYEAVNPQKIVEFLQSECAYRMWRADRAGKLHREQPFVLGIDAKELSGKFEGDAPEGETLLIQGIIDVFWMEDERIILLDYKTDKIGSMDLLWERYEAQMDYYSRALKQILGHPVTERILYSSYLGEAAGRP